MILLLHLHNFFPFYSNPVLFIWYFAFSNTAGKSRYVVVPAPPVLGLSVSLSLSLSSDPELIGASLDLSHFLHIQFSFDNVNKYNLSFVNS